MTRSIASATFIHSARRHHHDCIYIAILAQSRYAIATTTTSAGCCNAIVPSSRLHKRIL
jgi:hypothetical protein